MRASATIARVVLPLTLAAAVGAGCAFRASTTPERRFERAMTYAEFTGSDTTRQKEWRTSEGRASGSIAPFAERARAVGGHWHLLVVAENWCGDALNSVPYLAALDSASPNVEMRILRKKDAKALLEAHELDGRQATPLVLLLDSSYREKGTWIERPQSLRKYMKTNCAADEKKQLREWYATDAGRSMLGEITAMLEKAAGSPSRPAVATE